MSFTSINKNITIGRPRLSDPSMKKSKSMTICLTPNVYDRFIILSSDNKQPPAKMARMLIENAVKEEVTELQSDITVGSSPC